MTIARWAEGEEKVVDADTVTDALAEVAAVAVEPIIVVLEANGAAMDIVVGDPSGTVLAYFPQNYADVGLGSLHSVGDLEAASKDAWQPPLTAFYFDHHTELPRWSVVSP